MQWKLLIQATGRKGKTMSKLNSLQDLYIEELKDLYSAENQLTKALPKMAKAAANPELKMAFEEHLVQTQNQITRLEQIFKNWEISGKGKVCKGMQGVIEEGQEMLDEDGLPQVKDAGLISVAQRVEHYEIAGYGCVCTYAAQLGFKDDLRLLKETLNEEEATDKKLSHLAEHGINRQAQTKANAKH
jgi:ferritin-like metal-binding protein YciE